jgi:hypothetical protein
MLCLWDDSVCNSPSASNKASRAFARASAIAADCEAPRKEMVARLNKPTAMTVRSIIKDKVTVNANPRTFSGRVIGMLRDISAGDFSP